MKNWFGKLNTREKYFVTSGFLFLLFIVGYYFLWHPLQDHYTSLRESVIKNENRVLAMNSISARIQSLHNQGYKQNTKPGSLLLVTQTTLAKYKLNSYLKSTKQVGSNQISFVFQKVPFDRITSWLTDLSQHNQIHTQSISVKSTDTTGLVNINLTLSDD